MTARQAADRLGIKLDTLYAYVSRGRLRSVGMPGSRERRYQTEDVEALLGVRSSGPNDRAGDADALTPIIASSICLIENGQFYYRGEDAVRLAEAATLEEVATLLWGAQTSLGADIDRAPPSPSELSAPGLIERCQIRLAGMAGKDLPALDLTRGGVIRTGHRIIGELAACIASTVPSSAPIHDQLAQAWGLDAAKGDILRRCLVLIADHELNASTFVARCVASTGATPYAVVSAALGALSGRRHGGASARAEALFAEIARSGDPMVVMAERLARGEDLPAFGQFLYPNGDPRAAAILDAIVRTVPEARDLIETAASAGTRLTGRRPNVDFALAAAATGLGLPQNSALALFVIGRTVGWIAHAIEQYDSGVLIRPRARYAGPRPEQGTAS
ncbi:MAG: helix-turn-helix domain-containing protein [Alphaproteobacteria bacterium]|nr:helix-turn-helix domain-containing protein [Alphaproteobacteria bacterium]